MIYSFTYAQILNLQAARLNVMTLTQYEVETYTSGITLRNNSWWHHNLGLFYLSILDREMNFGHTS